MKLYLIFNLPKVQCKIGGYPARVSGHFLIEEGYGDRDRYHGQYEQNQRDKVPIKPVKRALFRIVL